MSAGDLRPPSFFEETLRPSDVGIVALEVYFPRRKVCLTCFASPLLISTFRLHRFQRAVSRSSHCHAPNQFYGAQVDQVDLESYDKVPAGKYTIGLGQVSGPFYSSQGTYLACFSRKMSELDELLCRVPWPSLMTERMLSA